MERGRIQGLPKFFGYPLLSQERVKLRTSNFVGTFIESIGTKVHENIGNSGRGRSQAVPKIFRAPIYRAHCAVIFAIAQLSCSVSCLSVCPNCVFYMDLHMYAFGIQLNVCMYACMTDETLMSCVGLTLSFQHVLKLSISRDDSSKTPTTSRGRHKDSTTQLIWQ